jgi:hypothetical protein
VTHSPHEPSTPAERYAADNLPTGSPTSLASFASAEEYGSIRAEFLRHLLGVCCPGGFDRRRVDLRDALVTGLLDLANQELNQALIFRGCQFAEPIVLEGAKVRRLSLLACRVPAISAEGLDCSGSVELRDGFESADQVDLLGARIGGQLDCMGGSFRSERIALRCDYAIVGLSVLLREGFRAYGTVNFPQARVGGDFDCTDGSFTSSAGTALFADHMKVGGSMYLRGSFTSTGRVNVLGATVEGQCDMTGATMSCPGDISLIAERITVGSGMYLAGDFTADGTVRLSHARIGRQLMLEGEFRSAAAGGAPMSDEAMCAIDLESATVDSDLVLKPTIADRRTAAIDLFGVKVEHLVHDPRLYPGIVRLQGLRYRDVVCLAHLDKDAGSPIEVNDRIAWVGRASAYTPQAYDQLADTYLKNGDEKAARRVRIAKQAHRQKQLGLPGRMWNTFLRYTVAYGYQPSRALAWLILLLILGSLAFRRGYADHQIVTRTTGSRDTFHAWAYTLDLLLPIVNLRQRDPWLATGSMYWWYILLQLAGWLLAAALAAAATRLLKRE